jgi:hypothetical protein
MRSNGGIPNGKALGCAKGFAAMVAALLAGSARAGSKLATNRTTASKERHIVLMGSPR